jgi:signal transduction histidine kinase
LIQINTAGKSGRIRYRLAEMHLIHDLRLVLIALTACLSAWQQRSAEASLPPELDQAKRLLETARALTDERLVSRFLRPVAPYFDVNALVYDFAAIVATIVGPEIDVRIKLGTGDARIYAQRADIERILLNLAFNAAAAMPAGGSLLIDTEVIENTTGAANSPPGNLRLTIRDTGRGMSEAELQRAMDPTAAPKLDGTGVGLACVAQILTRLGGVLAIESRHGHGTVVSILLPLADDHKIH